MGEKMSLEQVKAEMWEHMGHGFPRAEDDDMQRWIDALDAHLTRPAQAVDVPFPPLPNGLVIHPQLGPLFDRMQMHSYALQMTDSATRALRNANGKEG